MLWGAPSSPTSTDTAFLDSITSQLASGSNITHILSYNEPDGGSSTGGSSIAPDAAANTWMRNIKPLRDTHGIKVGLPATTGAPSGVTWLEKFNASCLALDPDGCKGDFIPIHWYGNFEGLASHMGQKRALYPTIPMWVTEYAIAGASLAETQQFYNSSAEYFDRMDYVERYSYFGAFRSDKSNVGPNAAFLTQNGDLTDIGSWYLGGTATGKVPKGGAVGRAAKREVGLVVGIVSVLAMFLGAW
jgi:Glycosyl hydrolase catalytic core